MPGDYIPRSDVDFSMWFTNFEAKLKASPTSFGLVAGDITPLTAAMADWDAKLLAHSDAQTDATSKRTIKDGSRASAEVIIRGLVRRLQASSAVDDGERAVLGITIPGSNPTPTGAPTTHPMAMVHCSRFQHTLSWVDSETARKQKPQGVLGAEIWVAVTVAGAATPTNPADFDFVALDTNSPYLKEWPAGEVGKNAHYILRWVRGEHKGPWSETVSCTIVG